MKSDEVRLGQTVWVKCKHTWRRAVVINHFKFRESIDSGGRNRLEDRYQLRALHNRKILPKMRLARSLVTPHPERPNDEPMGTKQPW